MSDEITVSQPVDVLGSDGAVVGRLEPGETYSALERVDGWVGTRDGAGTSGWVPELAVTEVPEPDGVADVAPAVSAELFWFEVDASTDIFDNDGVTVIGNLRPGAPYKVLAANWSDPAAPRAGHVGVGLFARVGDETMLVDDVRVEDLTD